MIQAAVRRGGGLQVMLVMLCMLHGRREGPGGSLVMLSGQSRPGEAHVIVPESRIRGSAGRVHLKVSVRW